MDCSLALRRAVRPRPFAMPGLFRLAGQVVASAPLVLAGLSVAVTVGVLYAGPVYRAAVAAELGWSLTTVVGAFAFGYLVALPTPVLAGAAVDRWGPRLVLQAAVALSALGLLGAAFVREPWQWYATTGVALAVAYYAVSPAALVVATTAERRGTMFGLVVGLGCGGGLVLGPSVAQLLVDGLGWRAAFGVQAVALGAVAVAWSVVRAPAKRATEQDTPNMDGDQLAAGGTEPTVGTTRPELGWLLPALFIGNALIAVFDEAVYQLAYPYALRLGLSGVAAAGLLTATSIGFTVGMVGGGVVSDRLGRGRVLVVAALMVAVSLLGLVWAGSATVWPWAVLFGVALGATITARSALWADLFAGPRLGRTAGILAAGYPLGAAAVTLGGAAWLDAGGSFTWVFASGMVAAVAWAGIVGAVTRRAR